MFCFLNGCRATEEALKSDISEQQRLKNSALDNVTALNDAVKVARNEADATRAEHMAYIKWSEEEIAKVTDELTEQGKINSAYMAAQWSHKSQCDEYERKLVTCRSTIDDRNIELVRLKSKIDYLQTLINPDLLPKVVEGDCLMVNALDAVPSEDPTDHSEAVDVTHNTEVEGQTSIDSDCFQDDDGDLICSKQG